MFWFSCVNDSSQSYKDMYLAALRSAKKNTILRPILVYDGKDTQFISSVKNLGARVHHHIFSGAATEVFQSKSIPWKKIFTGTYLRIDIPRICGDLSIYDKYVLYTDVDVLFVKDPVPILGLCMPEYFAACPEFEKDNWAYINAGILLLNVEAMSDTYDALMGLVNATYHVEGFDQTALNTFYRGKIDRLPLTMNHKPYWGADPDACIIHYHGPKPADISEYLESGTCVEPYRYLFAMVTNEIWSYYANLFGSYVRPSV
jgi:lipopolysaccharide biosynthesis glycosyltransferase